MGRAGKPTILMIVAVIGFASGLPPVYAGSPAQQDVSLAGFPRAFTADLRALPTTDNAWLLLGGAALTVAVYQFEDPDGATRVLDQGVIDFVSDSGNTWGDIKVQAPLALGLWGVGAWTGRREWAELGHDLSRGLLLSYGVVSALKFSVQRTRPNGDDLSFPSGHTAAAFTTAGVIARRYGGWAGGVAVSLGVFTAMGRMEDMKHFASDVAAGATIGWICGRNAGRPRNADATAWRLVPLGRGVALTRNF